MDTKKIALVWFKTNLRLRDNECLVRAIAENDFIVPFYCLDDLLFATTSFGFKKTGDFRLKFLRESLKQLGNELRNLGSGLVLLNGNPEKGIFKLAEDYDAHRIYAEKERAPEELNTQQKVAAELLKLNCTFLTSECRNLLNTTDLPFPITNLPEVFTEFRKRTERTVAIRPVLPIPVSIASPGLPPINLALLPDQVIADPRAVLQYQGGMLAAHDRLRHYFYDTQALSSYKVTRNGMVGENYSSKFSAWLALGCISAREIYHAIKAYETNHGANESTYWLFFELLWRDYFGFCMEKNGSQYFLRAANQQLKAVDPNKFNSALNKWVNGQTGVKFIDANMIELKLTGFMSNRGRQNVASYFCNDLKLDWRYGAAYFEQQLIDYDVCNNWGNWAYLAGVGHGPKANRYFNIAKQAATYDPNNLFQNLWLT